jgi:hypothetical protein
MALKDAAWHPKLKKAVMFFIGKKKGISNKLHPGMSSRSFDHALNVEPTILY